jgi:hypothetical protein
MGGNRHTGVGNAAALTDYASAADVIDQHLVYYTTGGSSGNYTITPSPAITAYAAGQRFAIKTNHTNTTSATLNVNSLGQKTILGPNGSSLSSGDILSGVIYEVTYNGTQFQLTTPLGGDSNLEIKYATANQTRQSTTTVSDHNQGLSQWSLTAGGIYMLDGYLHVSGASLGGIRLFLQFSNAVQSYGGFTVSSISSDGSAEGYTTTIAPDNEELAFVTGDLYAGLRLGGAFRANASTGGTLDLQWAQQNSNANVTTIIQGSWMLIRKIN